MLKVKLIAELPNGEGFVATSGNRVYFNVEQCFATNSYYVDPILNPKIGQTVFTLEDEISFTKSLIKKIASNI